MILFAVLIYVFFIYTRWFRKTEYDGLNNNKNKINHAIHETVNNMTGTLPDDKCVTECIKNCRTGYQKTIVGKVVEGTLDYTLNSGLQNYSYLLEPTELLHVGADIEFMDGSMGSTDLATENANLKLLAKYLTLLLRKNEAEKELYTLQTGKRQVYNSPTLLQINKKLTEFKQTIRDDPTALKYFNENLDITL